MPRLALLVCVMALGSCVTPDTGACGSPSAVLEGVIAADNARDLERVLTFYADDVVWIPPSRETVSRIDVIRERYVGMYRDFVPALTIRIDAERSSGDLAWVRGVTGGVLHPTAGGDDVRVHDNFVATLRCDGAAWRIEQMMWAPAA